MPRKRTPVVAVLNSSEDVVHMLTDALKDEGYLTVTAHVPEIKRGAEDLIELFRRHDPDAVIYDVSLPYAENWTFLQLVLNTELAQRRRFVITTTNKRVLEQEVGPTGSIELIGKPYDLEEILAAVRKALRPQRRARRASSS